MRAYPVAVRQSLLDAVDAGMSKSDVARRFDVGLATIKRYAAQRREQGHLVPKRPPGRPPLILPAQHGALLALVSSVLTLLLIRSRDFESGAARGAQSLDAAGAAPAEQPSPGPSGQPSPEPSG